MDSPTSGSPLHQTAHPRRPPTQKSVSLSHEPLASGIPSKQPTVYQSRTASASSSNAPASDKAHLPPYISSNARSNEYSSGESNDAGKWFESTNNAVQSNPSFADNGPLPFLRNSSISHIPPDGYALRDYPYRQASVPYHPSTSGVSTNVQGSAMEEFRSVIDDLTIVNKRLKQQLKKYERLYDDHLHDEKLFEVRFHSFPDGKKRELEEILRKFAADIEQSPNADYSVTSPRPPPFDPQKSTSSRGSRFAESGYASMSACGRNSTITPLNQATGHGRDCRHIAKARYNQQQQSIQSYLDDIPVNLLAENQIALTEESKKKLVVRRLEQIFIGKESALRSQLQPMQQEEVAQLAAMDDRRMQEATGQWSKPEGNREAHIMPARADDENIAEQNVLLKEFSPVPHIHEHGFAGSESPNQRPTRPLDLDLHRAGVPAQNMEYIQHLGFSPPDMILGRSPQDDHGWLYLNLLGNIAQLHTFNVTPDFVKDAIFEYGSKFELSHDGKKVRWRGNREVTTSKGESSSENQGKHLPHDIYGHSKSSASHTEKKPDSNAGLKPDSRQQLEQDSRTQNEPDQNKDTYIPLFSHREDSDGERDLYGFSVDSSSDWPQHVLQAGNFSVFRNSALRSSAKRCGDSPMIFYSKANFCTDLTGDRHGCSNLIPGSYTSVTTSLLGAPIPQRRLIRSPISGIGELRGSYSSSRMDVDSTGSQQDSSSDENIDFSLSALKGDNGTETFDTMEFEASGLGGVHLEDNFSIHVRRSRLQITPSYPRPTRHKPRLYSPRILATFNEGSFREAESSPLRQQWVFKEEILSTSRKSLPRSTLPPASFFAFDSTSSGDVDSDLESDVSSGPSTTSSSEKSLATAAICQHITGAHVQ